MNERIEELKAEIERLETNDNLDSEEFKQLKAMKEELKQLEAEVEAELARKELVVRPLQRRDIQVLQMLVKDYPGFNELAEGDRLDRIVLMLTNVCGFGGVLTSTIEAALVSIPYKLSISIEDHFKNSLWTNREGETRRRYVNNFAAAYKLEPGLALRLVSESKASKEEEPIRKTVPGKKSTEVVSKTPNSPEELSKQGVRTAPIEKAPLLDEEKLVTPSSAQPYEQSPSSEVKAEAEARNNAEPSLQETEAPSSSEKKEGAISRIFSIFKK